LPHPKSLSKREGLEKERDLKRWRKKTPSLLEGAGLRP